MRFYFVLLRYYSKILILRSHVGIPRLSIFFSRNLWYYVYSTAIACGFRRTAPCGKNYGEIAESPVEIYAKNVCGF